MNEQELKIHEAALRQFDRIQVSCKDERQQCFEDRRFYSIAGAQWEGKLGEQFENKPKLEINKVHLAVIRIFNEYRANRISVDFIGRGGETDAKLADLLDGLYRADEQDSDAQEAYDNAFEEATAGGFGAWRLRAVWEDEFDPENDDQRIVIEPIFEADANVFFDPAARKQDKSDAKYCFVVTPMTIEDYKEKYNDDPQGWPETISQHYFDWSTPEYVYVAEYYKEVLAPYELYTYRLIDGEEEKYSEMDFKADPELKKRLEGTGSTLIRTRTVKRRAIHKYVLSGGGILENNGRIAGEFIPIIPMFGKRLISGGIERCIGHVRLSKDAQRLKNMQSSKLAEISATGSVEKPILTPAQVKDHKDMWEEDNIKNYPYLLINPVEDKNGQQTVVGPAAYTKSPNVPPALATLLAMTEEDIKDLLGHQEQGERIGTNVSGKAVELIQTRLDMQVFIYMSNMAKAMKRSGEVWLSMARELMADYGRRLKVVGRDGQQSTITVGEPMLDESGRLVYANDISKARYSITTSVGPSSESRRAAVVRGLTGMMQLTKDQETMQILTAVTLMNMEGEGLSDIRKYYRWKLIKMGVVEPTLEETKRLAAEPAQPDPNAVYLEQAARNEAAKAVKAEADAALAVAKTKETEVKTIAGMSDIDRKDLEMMGKLEQGKPPALKGE